MEKKELIAEVEKRFEIALTIAIFFPILMAAYSGLTTKTALIDNLSFAFFVLPGYYILSYVFFQILKLMPNLPKLTLHILDWALLVGIACFAIPAIFIVMVGLKVSLGSTGLWLGTLEFSASMWGMLYADFSIFYFIAICIVLSTIPKKWANKKIF